MDERERRTLGGMCDTRVLLLHDAAAHSPVIRELFCQSVREISFCDPRRRDEPTRPGRTRVRTTYVCFGYLPADLRATSPRLPPASREARLPAVQTRRRGVCIYNASRNCVRLFGGIRTGARNRGGQVVITEIRALECKVFQVVNNNNRLRGNR